MATDLLVVQTLYAELLDYVQSSSFAALPPAVGFTVKTVKGRRYWYAQYTDANGGRRQDYLGADTPEVVSRIDRYRAQLADESTDLEQRERLVKALVAAGGTTPDRYSGRVLEHLAAAGVFRAGCVLVGTHAFALYANVLGTRLGQAITEDVDLASHLSLAASGEARQRLPEVLAEADERFFAVPRLDPRQPSTSWKVRGRAFRVDLLTPAEEAATAPVPVGAHAHPLPYLGYLLEAPMPAVMLHGAGILVNVPLPERFALHKLIVAERRPRAEQAKRNKDLEQATQLLAWFLQHERRALGAAAADLLAQGARWQALLSAGIERLPVKVQEELSALLATL